MPSFKKNTIKIFSFLIWLVLLPGETYSTGIYFVDVSRIFSESDTAKAARDHLSEVRKVLEKGYDKLRYAYDTQPEDVRQKILSEGAASLNQQLAREQQAVDAIVLKRMNEEITAWRKINKADAILPGQTALDFAEERDITDAIIKAMDKKKPVFADLPVITVKEPAQNNLSPGPDKKSEETSHFTSPGSMPDKTGGNP